jgi:hypothetical protein
LFNRRVATSFTIECRLSLADSLTSGNIPQDDMNGGAENRASRKACITAFAGAVSLRFAVLSRFDWVARAKFHLLMPKVEGP